MKFLTISKMKDSATLVPPATMRQLMEATLAWMDGQQKAGIILEAYAIPSGGTVVICEHSSVDDVAKTVASIPMGGLLNCEVYPLADINETMKVYVESLKSAEQSIPK